MSTTLSPADRCAACVIALVSLLMFAGVRYIFQDPAHATLTVVSAERPHLP